MFAMEVLGDRKDPETTSHHPAFPKIARLLFHKKHPPCADQQKRTEEVEDKIEPVHQCDTEDNHDAAHDQRPDDSPDQSAMLSHRRDAEVGEDQNENENVVNAERVLDHVAGQKFERLLWAADFPDH